MEACYLQRNGTCHSPERIADGLKQQNKNVRQKCDPQFAEDKADSRFTDGRKLQKAFGFEKIGKVF